MSDNTRRNLLLGIAGIGGALAVGIEPASAVGAVSTEFDANYALAQPVFYTSGSGDERAAINVFLSAPTPKGAKRIVGSASVDGSLIVPANTVLDLSQATITQLGTLRPILTLGGNCTVQGGRLVGNGTDWLDSSTVYGAAGIFIPAGASGCILDGVKVSNMAGAGVLFTVGLSGARIVNCDLSGVGSDIIPVGVGGRCSGGVVFNNNGFSDITISGGSIKDFAQGIVGGEITNLYVGGGIKISTVGQHGIYFAAASNTVLSHIRMDSIALEGIKLQLTESSATDTDRVVISDVVMKSVGSHGVHLANVDPTAPTVQARRVSIHDVVVTHSALGSGDDILIEYSSDVTVHDVIGYNGMRGLRASNSARLKVHDNEFCNTNGSGIHLSGISDSDFNDNRVVNPAHALTAGDKFGIYVASSSADLRFMGNRVTDASGNMQYGIYVADVDATSMQFLNNKASGASDFGFRMDRLSLVATWANNNLKGTLGQFYNTPPNANNEFPSFANLMLGWAFDPVAASLGQAATVAGTLAVSKMVVPSGGPITKVHAHVSTAGARLNSGQCLIGVYDSAGKLIGKTADLSIDWLSTGAKIYKLVNPTVDLANGESIYVATIWNGTTGPLLRGINGTGQGNIGIATSAMRFSTAGTGLTALPSTMPTKVASSRAIWFGVS